MKDKKITLRIDDNPHCVISLSFSSLFQMMIILKIL